MVRIPEYSNLIASDSGELVLSRPGWYRKHGKPSSLLVDARAWPPAIVKVPGVRIAAAARAASGQWVVVAKHGDEPWQIRWYAIGGGEPLRVDEPPFATPSPATDEDADDGPFRALVPFGDDMIGVPVGARAAFVLRDGRWLEDPRLHAPEEPVHAAQVPFLDGERALEWNAQLFDRELRSLDARGCTKLVGAAGRVFALHAEQLVELTATELVPRLAGHTTSAVQRGPGTTLLLTLVRDDARGHAFEHVLYDVVADTVTSLPASLVGPFPKIVAITDAGDLVLHDDNTHHLKRCPATKLAKLRRVPASTIEPPAPLLLDVTDDIGAASRPTVATARDRIVMAVGPHLRFHSIDSPTGVLALDAAVVAVVAHGARFAALDARGLLHLFGLDGTALASRPVPGARSLAADRDGRWLVAGERAAIVDEARVHPLDVDAPLAFGPDPDGGFVVACDGNRLVHWTGTELRDLPPTREQIVAIAPLGGGRFACAGRRDLYLLDLAHPELTSLDRRLRRPHLATHVPTGRIAYCDSPGAVEIEQFADGKLASCLRGGVRYSSYSAPTSDEVTVHGLAFLDDGRLVIQLDAGRGNIVDAETAATLKLDEQADDPRGRWIFICGGKILIAD